MMDDATRLAYNVLDCYEYDKTKMHVDLKTVREIVEIALDSNKVDNYRLCIETNNVMFMIVKLLGALGWELSPLNMIFEYKTDHVHDINKKVDIGLIVKGEVEILVECKKFGESLDGWVEQLAEYFENTTAKLAILTNGVDYWFFARSGVTQIMSRLPYASIKLTEASDEELRYLGIYSKEFVESHINILDDFGTLLGMAAGADEAFARVSNQYKYSKFIDDNAASDFLYSIGKLNLIRNKTAVNEVVTKLLTGHLANFEEKITECNREETNVILFEHCTDLKTDILQAIEEDDRIPDKYKNYIVNKIGAKCKGHTDQMLFTEVSSDEHYRNFLEYLTNYITENPELNLVPHETRDNPKRERVLYGCKEANIYLTTLIDRTDVAIVAKTEEYYKAICRKQNLLDLEFDSTLDWEQNSEKSKRVVFHIPYSIFNLESYEEFNKACFDITEAASKMKKCLTNILGFRGCVDGRAFRHSVIGKENKRSKIDASVAHKLSELSDGDFSNRTIENFYIDGVNTDVKNFASLIKYMTKYVLDNKYCTTNELLTLGDWNIRTDKNKDNDGKGGYFYNIEGYNIYVNVRGASGAIMTRLRHILNKSSISQDRLEFKFAA